MAAMVVVGILGRKSGASEIVRDASNTLFVVATALAVQLLIFYVAWGVVFTKYLPDLNWGFKFFWTCCKRWHFGQPLFAVGDPAALLRVADSWRDKAGGELREAIFN